MLKHIETAIFDLDGTIIDSMGVWDKIDMDYLKKFGYEKPDNLKEEITHLSFYDTAIYFKKRFNINSSIEEMLNTWHDMSYYEYKNNVKLKPGVKKFLYKLKNLNINIALATSNSQTLLKACLESNNVLHLFDSITTTDEVKIGKDNPHIYLVASKKHNTNPKNCIVFEDILSAVKSAKLAGMTVVAVEDTSSCSEKLLLKKTANYYIKSFIELL